jgi:hypothetical protein
MNKVAMDHQIIALRARVEFLEKLLNVFGEWISPTQGAEILPLSKDRILQEIRIAEQARILRKKVDLIYGEHYYNNLFPYDHIPGEGLVENSNKQRSTWMIHREKFWEVVRKPIEERNFD